MIAPTVPRHPAKWSAPVLDVLAEVVRAEAERLGRQVDVFDPFAGVGRARLAEALGDAAIYVAGIELEPEWAGADPDPHTRVGDALQLLPNWFDSFDVMVTSPTYGNRMADCHENRDPCGTCGGMGTKRATAGHCFDIDGGLWHGVGECAAPECQQTPCCAPCPNCKGDGRSVRNTYRHALDRMPSQGSSSVLQWGREYRAFHDRAWMLALGALHSCGLAVVNVSNHIRDDKEQRVVEYHLSSFMLQGCTVEEVRKVPTQRQRKGENGDLRVDGERVLVMRAPERKGML